MNTSRLVLSCGCNQHCMFCDAAAAAAEDGAEFAAAELARGTRAGRVNITGGEPTLDPRLPSLIRKIKKSGLKYVAVLTNGLKLSSKKYLLELESAGTDEIILSFFEPEPERYDLLTGTPGALARKLKALENLRGSAVKTTVNLLVYSGNQSSADKILERLHTEYGIRNFALSVLEPDCERVLARPWLIPEIGTVLRSLSRISKYCKKHRLSCLVPANGAIPRCAAEKLRLAYPAGEVNGADMQERTRIKPDALCSGCARKVACAGMIRVYALGLARFLKRSRPDA